MFGFSRQSSAVTPVKALSAEESAKAKALRDRRKVSGERVVCKCEFTLPSSDPFVHCKVHTRGMIILNVRGCCVYPEEVLSQDDTKRTFPESRLLTIKNMIVTGTDGQIFDLPNLTIRRVRLVTDEHGDGIILRFVNLTEDQLDTLVSISNKYKTSE